MIEIFAMTWLAWPILGFVAGSFRGQPRAGMWLGVLGPIGLLMLLVGLPDVRLRCPDCRGVVPEGASKCMHCAASFPGQIQWAKKPTGVSLSASVPFLVVVLGVAAVAIATMLLR